MIDDRRTFIGRSLLAVLMGASRLDATEATPQETGWLAAITGRRHNAFLDITRFFPDGTPFRRTHSLIDTLSASYRVPKTDIGVAFGAHSTGLAHLLTEETWDQLSIAKWLSSRLEPQDQDGLLTGSNWGSMGADGVRRLQAEGVRVLACGQTISSWAQSLSGDHKATSETIRQQLLHGLHPGIEVVPAMIAAAVMAQAARVPYVAIT